MSEPLLEVRNLSKTFTTEQGDLPVLSGVNLSLQPSERVAIVGQSGVGKSTLLYILGALDRPTGGEVRFEGEDLFAKSREALSQFRNHSLGFVFQFHHLLPEFDALENVMMPGRIRGMARSELSDRAREILGEVGLAARLHHKVGKLSGGERQRVAVARALVLSPSLLLADEPTGNLDAETGERIEALLLSMNASRGTAMVVVTHNERLADELGRCVTLRAGTL
ncbi:MAG: ABC transporter ATP-binding protein [Deltaproteobacteria bacterium]|nr:ABC transporter ATP-binding protein [Deltaproteobacteria bacterium]MBW2446941.1 ABC transporter ATP-binding protein [Deltaproteobacteria bacterium]